MTLFKSVLLCLTVTFLLGCHTVTKKPEFPKPPEHLMRSAPVLTPLVSTPTL